MRQIGTLPETTDPNVFGDYLLSLGVTSRAVQSKDGWAVWVHHEDHVAKARDELSAYLRDSANPRYAEAVGAAKAAEREEARRLADYAKRVHVMSGKFDGLNARRRPLTVALMAVCIAVQVAVMTTPHVEGWLIDHLMFFGLHSVGPVADAGEGLADIHSGQVWRLVTPIFLHVNLLHLVMNMSAIYYLGSVIEYRRGTGTLAALTFLSAVASNVAEYLVQVFYAQNLHGWAGISGVAFAYFGYIWLKGRFEPEQGMMMSQGSVRLGLLWILIGISGIFPMANGGHVGGLVVGMLFALARF